MSTVLYHGSKQERMSIRMKLMPKTVGSKFPIVITSYEVAMNDARVLSKYKWKYVVVDEVTPNLSQCFPLLCLALLNFMFIISCSFCL